VQVTCSSHHGPVDLLCAQRRNGSQVGQDRPVMGLRQDDTQTGAEHRIDDACRNIHAARGHSPQHEMAHLVIAHHAEKSRMQAQARRAAGHDGRRGANGQRRLFHQLFGLPKDRLEIGPGQDQVGVDLTHDQ
jgi:hypothetical protein